jgi:preprotein translocase subunit SecE
MMQRQEALGPDGAPGTARRREAAGRPPSAPERRPLLERSVEYLREVRGELQKVAWPGRTEVANYTVVVFVTIVLLTALVFGLDYAFAKGVIYLFPK